jgi:hypothetical protein
VTESTITNLCEQWVCPIDPTVQDTTIRLYAGEIKKAANGRRSGIGRQARRKVKIQLERRVKTNGEIHVRKATGGFCEDKTEKAPNQESIAANRGKVSTSKYNHSRNLQRTKIVKFNSIGPLLSLVR